MMTRCGVCGQRVPAESKCRMCGAELLNGLFATPKTPAKLATVKPKERERRAQLQAGRERRPHKPTGTRNRPREVRSRRVLPFSDGLRSFLFGAAGSWHLQKDGKYWLVEVVCHVPAQDLTGQQLRWDCLGETTTPNVFRARP